MFKSILIDELYDEYLSIEHRLKSQLAQLKMEEYKARVKIICDPDPIYLEDFKGFRNKRR
jgi:hypothetical protein